MQILSLEQHIDCETVATIGFFDGVHLGHRFLLDELTRRAKQTHCASLVVSFADSPARALHPMSDVGLLTTPVEKVQLFDQAGIDYCLILNFDTYLARLKAAEFLTLIKNRCGVRRLLLGYDHHFGSDRLRSFSDYRSVAEKVGVTLERETSFAVDGTVVGSRIIRDCLTAGRVGEANKLLGYAYTITGRVAHGRALGRTIGFPTANLTVSPRKLLPKNGVYVVDVLVSGLIYKGLLNIGTRPTVEGDERTVEVHIIDFVGNIYDQQVTLKLQNFLRAEQKFDSLDELKHQIENDKSHLQR
ncbi:MAG: bifunctional riboflavin kinase/FAD synthetase [Paludibacteraceae bacterium]